MTRPRHGGGKRAFTLIELLVIIAILAILAGLLFPALLGARERSAAVTCLSNVRQVIMASLNYAVEHKGEFPVTYRNSGGSAAGEDFWAKVLPYLPGRDLSNREEAMAVYQCPLAKSQGWNHLINGDPATLAGNHVILNQSVSNAPVILPALVQRPAKAMLFTDSSSWSEAWGGTLSGTVSASVPPAFLHGGRTEAGGGNGGGQWHYFQDGEAVFGYADGHAEMLPVTPVTLGNTSTTTGRLFWAGREYW